MRSAGLLLLTLPLLFAQSPFYSKAPANEELRFDTSLPAFEAKDIAGRTWRLDDLRGKWTLVYVFHTFEARAIDAHKQLREVVPGFSDLPEVQRFHAKWRGSKSIQVLTFCRDYDYTHAPEYMKSAGYSFPVIADWVLLKKVLPDGDTSPSYRVVDHEGRVSTPPRSWSFGRVLYEIERVAAR